MSDSTPDPALEARIRQVIERVLRVPPGCYEVLDRAHVREWDSLKHVELVFAVEDEFNVRLREEEFPELTSADRIARIVAGHRAARA